MIGTIADDVTGGTDVAVAFRRHGLRTLLFFGVPTSSTGLPDHDAVVIATKTRMAAVEQAVATSLDAHAWLSRLGVTQTYFKYCSTFDSTPRGNIGPVLDALSEATGAATVVTTPSSPEHGRTQYAGHLFVGDVLLADSHMRNHPVTPMTESNLVELLRPQTHERVGLIPYRDISLGAAVIGARLRDAESDGVRYLFADALTDDDLREIARAVSGLPLVAGAAGFAGSLAAALVERAEGSRGASCEIQQPPKGATAILSGSCSVRTLEQLEDLRRASRPSHFLDVVATPDAHDLARSALQWYDSLDPKDAPVIYSSVEPERLRGIQDAVGATRSARVIEEATARIAQGLVERGVNRVITAGGETSGAVVDALGVEGGIVGEEAARGVPWIHSSDGRLALLLKSGNFGEPDLLTRTSLDPRDGDEG